MSQNAKNHPYLSAGEEPLPLDLGINGVGRIGKLTLWHHVSRRSFRSLVVNVGREAGGGMEDIVEYLVRDSTYGPLDRYIYGFRGGRLIEGLRESEGSLTINGVPVTVLRETRNPREIPWRESGVDIVVDCTGAFRDPAAPADSAKGSLRGHLEAGAKKVMLSAPFKIKGPSKSIPEDAITSIQGINETAYVPERHHIISTASCTTTCLAYMVKTLLDRFGPEPILGASMVTVHATTGTQEVLDRMPAAEATDLRKNRSIFNNIILTTTGAADALGWVIPEMKEIGFIAESVRIPTNTGSIVILVVNIQDDDPASPINRDQINGIYREAADGYLSRYLSYTDLQNVSSDVIGTASAAIIEGRETRTHTAKVRVRISPACRI
jgi:glyceraldehyde 3-phosphate dehydrogenase